MEPEMPQKNTKAPQKNTKAPQKNTKAPQENTKIPQNNTDALLEKLLHKMESFEKTMHKVENSMQQFPGFVGMFTDSMDESLNEAKKEGIDVPDRVEKATVLFEKLTRPETMNFLSNLLEKMDKFSNTLEQLEKIPGMLSMATDSFDEVYQSSKEYNIDFEERTRSGLEILAKLTEPKNISAISQMLDKTEKLLPALNSLEQLPGLGAMITDTIDEYCQKNLQGVDLVENMQNALDISVKLTNSSASKIIATVLDEDAGLVVKLQELLDSQEFKSLMDSEIIHPKTVEVVSLMGHAMVESKNCEKASIWQLLTALFNKDIRQSLGFLICFGKNFGKSLEGKINEKSV